MATNERQVLNPNEKGDTNENDDEMDELYLRSHGPLFSGRSADTSTRSFSSSMLTVRGSNSCVDEDVCSQHVGNCTYHTQLIGKVNKSEVHENKGNLAKQCVKCLKCKEFETTHFCKSCRHGRQYMCHVCLRDHNHWFVDHDVVSLTVNIEGNLDFVEDLDKTDICREDTKTSPIPQSERKDPQGKETFTTNRSQKQDTGNTDHRQGSRKQRKQEGYLGEHNVRTISNDNRCKYPSNVRRDDDLTKGKCLLNSMTTKPTDDNDRLKSASHDGRGNNKIFYKDNLYLDIAHELRTKQNFSSERKLQKYGKRSIRMRYDSKVCAITGIVQLESKRLLLTDSENCELKLMDEETFRIIISHELHSNPYLMCIYKENKVLIAFINFEFHLVDINAGIDIVKSFEIKTMFKAIACSTNKILGCTANAIGVYSDTGKQISNFKPVDVTNIEDMCVSNDGDIVFCADEKKGILVFDKHGNILDVISENLCNPQRFCLGQHGYIFATEKNSDRVMKVNVLLRSVEQIERDDSFTSNNPIALCHEKTNNRLIVALWQSDEIHVYNCPNGR